MKFLFKVHLWVVLFMHSVVLLKTTGSRGSQRMQGQNLKESKWNSICSAICVNSTVSVSKLNSLISYSCLPHWGGGERGQCSTGGNHHTSNISKLWQFSPVKDLSQEVQVVSVGDLVRVITMRFCLWISPKYFLREIISRAFQYVFKCWLGGYIFFNYFFFL